MSLHIKPEVARNIAYMWHGGMWSPLYAFASSGLIADLNALLGEIRECMEVAETKTDKRHLNSLYRFARDCVVHIPGQYPYAAPWAKEIH